MTDDVSSVATPAGRPRTEMVMVWDWLVRVLHWGTAALFVVAFLSEDFIGLHKLAGYTILGFVTARIVWGFIGSTHARFSDFMRPPADAIRYLRGLRDGTAPRSLGHNAAGGWMTVALLAGLIACGVTGWLLTRQPGEPAAWLKDIHEIAANATLTLVLVHLAGVAASSLRHGENLIKAMITGRKPATTDTHTAKE